MASIQVDYGYNQGIFAAYRPEATNTQGGLVTVKAVLNVSLCVFVQFSACEFMGNVGVHHTIDRCLANV